MPGTTVDPEQLRDELVEHLDGLGVDVEPMTDPQGRPGVVAANLTSHVVVSVTATGELVDEAGRAVRLRGFSDERGRARLATAGVSPRAARRP